MLICFTGLHAAGKSYFLNKIPEYFDFKIFDKKQILRRLYFLETGKTDEDWNLWYGQKFEEDPVAIVSRILACLPLEENVILDAVHSNYEWELIKGLVPDSHLGLIVTPPEEREIRWANRETIPRDLKTFDKKRIKYWHNPKANNACLAAQASWTFNGAASEELIMHEFQEFLDYLAREKELKQKQEDVNVLRLRKKNE